MIADVTNEASTGGFFLEALDPAFGSPIVLSRSSPPGAAWCR